MGSVLALPVTVPVSGARTRLSDFLRRRKQLVEIRKAEKLHRHSAGQEEISTAIDAMIALLASQIADLGRSRHRPDSAGDPSRRTSRTRNPLPASHRLAGRACTPCPGKRNLARRTPHLGRETESPGSPLHRGPGRVTKDPSTCRHALSNAPQGQGPKKPFSSPSHARSSSSSMRCCAPAPRSLSHEQHSCPHKSEIRQTGISCCDVASSYH